MMQLSARSRTTSISYSFQPSTDSSISTSVIGEASRPPRDDLLEFLAVVGDAAAGAAQREGRPDDRRQADLGRARSIASSSVCDQPALRAVEADPVHRLAEQLAVLGLVDRLGVGADHLDARSAPARPARRERQRGVERGLAAHGRQQRVRAARAGDDLLDDLRRDRLDIGGVGQLRIGHDRRRVRVDQDDPVALARAAPCTPARRNSRTRRPGR